MSGEKLLATTASIGVGSLAGGLLGAYIGADWSKREIQLLKVLTSKLVDRLKKQPKLYSQYVRLDQAIKDHDELPEGAKKRELKELIFNLKDSFQKGLTPQDKESYLKIQKLSNKAASISKGYMTIGISIGGLAGLIIGQQLTK